MKKTIWLVTLAAAFATASLAAEWSGRLLDAACHDQNKMAACDANSSTTAFAIDASGKVLKFNASGNQKAAAALKNRADRAADPAQPAKAVMAKVSGTEEGGVIEVSEIDVQ